MIALFLWAALAVAGPRVAVADLRNRTGDTSLDGAGAGISGVLMAKLLRVSALEVVERERLEAVLGEIGLGQGGAIDPATAAKAGKLLGASHLVTGDLVSVKLPAVAISLRVVEVETGRVVAASEVNGQVGEHGEEFFVLVDDAAAKVVDALAVKLAAKDRIALSQVDVEKLGTIDAYGDALLALDRGDVEGARARLNDALSAEPGFHLAEDVLAKLAAYVAAERATYAHEAITKAHAALDAFEKTLGGTLPASPTVEDLAVAALRSRMRLVRGDLGGYLALEDDRVAATTPAHVEARYAFETAVRSRVTDPWLRTNTFARLAIVPWEVRHQQADVLLILGRGDDAAKLVIDAYQHPGPLATPSSRPRDPTDWAERHDRWDLAVIGRKQALEQAKRLGREPEEKRALDKLDDAIRKATAARADRAAYDTAAAKLASSSASRDVLLAERKGLSAAKGDAALALQGYAAFRARVKAGYYASVRESSEYRDIAEGWTNRAQSVWGEPWHADRELGVWVALDEVLPPRDQAEIDRRRKALDGWVTGTYGK